jgi:hypothetical protein
MNFSQQDTYEIHPMNESLISWMNFALTKGLGCYEFLDLCSDVGYDSRVAVQACQEASYVCADGIHFMWAMYSGRSDSDIRASAGSAPSFMTSYRKWLNLLETQARLGVKSVYVTSNPEVFADFYSNGDYARDMFLKQMAELADGGYTVALCFGDADFQRQLDGRRSCCPGSKLDWQEKLRSCRIRKIHE